MQDVEEEEDFDFDYDDDFEDLWRCNEINDEFKIVSFMECRIFNLILTLIMV